MPVTTDPVSTAEAANGRAARALSALADITAELASARSLEHTIERALGTLRAFLGADEVALWLHTPTGLSRGWGVGDQAVSEAQVRSGLGDTMSESRDSIFAPAILGDRRVGALVLRRAARLNDEERLLVKAVAHLLAPELAHAERSRQLEVEVASRTAEIERGRRFTEKIIDSLPLGLYVIDREYRIQSWNRKRETGMQGVSREEAIGRTIFHILHRQPAEMLKREFDDVFTSGRMQEYQMESVASGEARTYRITKIPMRLGDGPVTHVITIGEDITDWTQAQARFSQAEKLAAIGQLAAGIMHEINNPLATIAACAESLGYRIEDLERDGATITPDTHDVLG